MNQPVEIVEGVWVLHNPSLGRNMGLLTGEKGVVLVDPVDDAADLDTIEKGLEQQGREIEGIVFTRRENASVPERWSNVRLLEPDMDGSRALLPISMPGWETVPLSGEVLGVAGLYDIYERVLFCGEMLADIEAGEAIPSLLGGSRWYIDALATVGGLDVKLLVPSVGSVTRGKRSIKKRIENDRSYVYDVRRLVIGSLMEGVSLDRVLQVSAEVHEDFAYLEAHLANIRGVWEELSVR